MLTFYDPSDDALDEKSLHDLDSISKYDHKLFKDWLRGYPISTIEIRVLIVWNVNFAPKTAKILPPGCSKNDIFLIE